MDSIRVSEAPDTGSIPVEATSIFTFSCKSFYYKGFLFWFKHGLNIPKRARRAGKKTEISLLADFLLSQHFGFFGKRSD